MKRPRKVRRKRKPFFLELVQGPGRRRKFTLRKNLVIVGRSREAEIRIASKEVSRKHMLLKKTGLEYTCTDMESHNGIYLNRTKIHSATLRDGDTLQLGDVIFVYHEGT
jgi:pSer/pThr/pTyr-binding forkhead associated (FHA) protein